MNNHVPQDYLSEYSSKPPPQPTHTGVESERDRRLRLRAEERANRMKGNVGSVYGPSTPSSDMAAVLKPDQVDLPSSQKEYADQLFNQLLSQRSSSRPGTASSVPRNDPAVFREDAPAPQPFPSQMPSNANDKMARYKAELLKQMEEDKARKEREKQEIMKAKYEAMYNESETKPSVPTVHKKSDPNKPSDDNPHAERYQQHMQSSRRPQTGHTAQERPNFDSNPYTNSRDPGPSYNPNPIRAPEGYPVQNPQSSPVSYEQNPSFPYSQMNQNQAQIPPNQAQMNPKPSSGLPSHEEIQLIKAERDKARMEMLKMREMMVKEKEKQLEDMMSMMKMQSEFMDPRFMPYNLPEMYKMYQQNHYSPYQNYENPQMVPPSYQNPHMMPPNYQNPQAMPPSYQSPQAMPPSYQNPQAMSPSYQNPQAMSPSYQNPQAMPPSYQNPQMMSLNDQSLVEDPPNNPGLHSHSNSLEASQSPSTRKSSKSSEKLDIFEQSLTSNTKWVPVNSSNSNIQNPLFAIPEEIPQNPEDERPIRPASNQIYYAEDDRPIKPASGDIYNQVASRESQREQKEQREQDHSFNEDDPEEFRFREREREREREKERERSNAEESYRSYEGFDDLKSYRDYYHNDKLSGFCDRDLRYEERESILRSKESSVLNKPPLSPNKYQPSMPKQQEVPFKLPSLEADERDYTAFESYKLPNLDKLDNLDKIEYNNKGNFYEVSYKDKIYDSKNYDKHQYDFPPYLYEPNISEIEFKHEEPVFRRKYDERPIRPLRSPEERPVGLGGRTEERPIRPGGRTEERPIRPAGRAEERPKTFVPSDEDIPYEDMNESYDAFSESGDFVPVTKTIDPLYRSKEIVMQGPKFQESIDYEIDRGSPDQFFKPSSTRSNPYSKPIVIDVFKDKMATKCLESPKTDRSLSQRNKLEEARRLAKEAKSPTEQDDILANLQPKPFYFNFTGEEEAPSIHISGGAARRSRRYDS